MRVTATVVFRRRVRETDLAAVRDIVVSTGFFSAAEVDVAEELVAEHLARGEASGYFFVFAEEAGGTALGYACYGPTPCTASTVDLYWIAVRNECRGRGVGRLLLAEVERLLPAGSKVVAETSSRQQYEATRRFYQSCGFEPEARIRDYYAPGEDIVYYTKYVAL